MEVALISPSTERHDVAVIGGGIVGLATAMALGEPPERRVVVLEAEPRLAAHQTGHNSGVIHSGLYYAPGSLKARLCVEGREAMFRFCAAEGVAHERCGKLVIATAGDEIPRLDELASCAPRPAPSPLPEERGPVRDQRDRPLPLCRRVEVEEEPLAVG